MSSNAPRPDSDPIWTLLLVVVMLVGFGWLIWWIARIPMLEFMRYLRLGELWIIGLFSTDHLTACYDWLKQAPTTTVTPTEEGARLTAACFGNLSALPSGQEIDYYNLTGRSIGVIGHLTARYLRVPMALFFVCMAVYAVFLSPRNKFKTRHTLESFIKVQAKMWPVISPIVNFKPATLSARIPGSKVPDKIPPFAEALSPEEWLSWHRIPMNNGIPDREAARRAFAQQLGSRWQGIEGQPVHIRALFATFALKGVQKREESDELLGQLATCWTLENGLKVTPDIMSRIDRALRDPKIGGEAIEIAAQYAYRVTAMLGVLKWAREMGGVLASAQFLWLRAVDRGLWYPLNNLGRRSFHSEGSGAIAHFMAEQSARKPLPIPRVDTAIVAINQFLSEPDKHSMPIPPREESKAKT